MRIIARALIVCGAVLGFSGLVPAGEPLDGILYFAGREYVVTVSPLDEESRNAENADLYERSGVEAAWKNLGRSERIVLPDGGVRFLKLVKVDLDGVYRYTSRPVVGGETSSPPGPDSPPQAVVVVDALPPRVRIVRPPDPARAVAGEAMGIAWVVLDENLDEFPAVLQWSRDDGDVWRLLADNLLPAGEMVWPVPSDVSGRMLLKLVAADMAGNRGSSVKLVEVGGGTPVPAPIPGDGACVAECPQYDGNEAWSHYLMAADLMRRNLPLEALPYYWRSAREDPDFLDVWADIGLAYIEAGAYKTARETLLGAMRRSPGRIDLRLLMGESFQAEGMGLLARSGFGEDRNAALQLIEGAEGWYERAVEAASRESRPSESAAALYRLGEIRCFVENDRDGARVYWRKVLELPGPQPDAALPEGAAEDSRYRRHARMRAALDAWRNWARGYLEQLDALERAGSDEPMRARKIGPSRAAIGLDAP
ncbi:MAG: hypothetical protein LBT97_08360 [Planctomycetota bacterium]|jgi:tetratricopeptide (TPR) repeat protein|nr:hypothetical protein [Planctomycetota bacterium]